ncbi:MAG: SRPBCC domain-containing protein [Armatimonadetes bacterium]|nr:SRPBCC domain-containing protein [Armatimonadota bacterium]
MGNDRPIVVEQTYSAPVEDVWRAITDQDLMPRWFFEEIQAFRPEPGFETQFNVRFEDRDFLHQWRITEVVPRQRIVYNWKYGGHPGESFVTWELAETPAGTRLKLTHRGLESFPQDEPAFRRDSCEAGWQYFLGERLKEFLSRTNTGSASSRP